MQYLVADMEAHYAILPNQPNLREIWAFHERLVLPPSQRGPNELTREFTVVYPDPDREAAAPGTGGRTKNKDLGAWQSYMAWEYGTDWVAGFLAHRRRYVAGPPPANVNLWPIAPLTHLESEESEEEEGDGEGQGDAKDSPKAGDRRASQPHPARSWRPQASCLPPLPLQSPPQGGQAFRRHLSFQPPRSPPHRWRLHRCQ
jgi:hypothetical protein